MAEVMDLLWDAPQPGALHLPGSEVTRHADGARALADRLGRVRTAHR